MAKRHPHLAGNEDEMPHGHDGIHPFHRPSPMHAYGGHHDQERAGTHMSRDGETEAQPEGKLEAARKSGESLSDEEHVGPHETAVPREHES